MKRTHFNIRVGATMALLFVAALVARAAANDVRTWVSTGGATVQASLETVAGSMVHLKTTDGRTVSIPLSKLSDDDQAFVRLARGTADTNSDSQAPAQTLTARLRRPMGNGPLTDEQIAELKTRWVDQDSGDTYTFTASLGTARMSTTDKRKYAKSGEVPFRVTAMLTRSFMKSGKRVSKLESGTTHFYILDAEGNEILKPHAASLDKMCPS